MEKNYLQECFQKDGIELPKYNTVQVGGSPHMPQWKSTVTLFNGQSFTGDISSKKKGAELSAACLALDHIQTEGIEIKPCDIPRAKPKIMFSKNRIKFKGKPDKNWNIFVDIENQELILNELCQSLPIENIYVYGYLSKSREHELMGNLDCDSRTTIIVAPTTRADGADIALTLGVGRMSVEDPDDGYIIVTCDHFGDALVDILQERGVDICTCRSLDEVVDRITSSQ